MTENYYNRNIISDVGGLKNKSKYKSINRYKYTKKNKTSKKNKTLKKNKNINKQKKRYNSHKNTYVKTSPLTQSQSHTITPMNCSPAVKGKSVSDNSCLTPDILLKIKNKYNEDHSNNPIITKDPREIWTELNNRLTVEGCKKEDCWLKELDDDSLRKQIDKHIFAPDMPNEWLTNPDEWLSNFDIANVLEQYEKTYPTFKLMGPTTMDFDTKLTEKGGQCVEEEICKFDLKTDIKKGFKQFACVVNLDKHWQSGSHWVSLFVNVPEQIIFYFDSAGCSSTPKEIIALVDRIKEQGKYLKMPVDFKFLTNGKHDHQRGSTECGMYSIFFIITMLTGKTPFHKDKILTIQERIDLFLAKRIPDEVIFDYRDLYFNKPDK
jgi:hypothetical protein